MQAKEGDKVKIHYTAKLEDGTVIDSSVDNDPLQFFIGDKEVIAGLEEAVIGMSVGETKTEKISCEKAYGPYGEEKVLVLPLDKIPSKLNPQIGQVLEIHQQDGKKVAVRVTDISDSKVTLDANHPVAGKDLILYIELIEIIGDN